MPSRRDTLRATPNPERTESTSRKEDYKAYAERDVDDGWPYSDEPGPEEERLQDNRPYAEEEEVEVAPTEGFHVEESPASQNDADERDETVRDYLSDQDKRGGTPEDESGDRANDRQSRK